MVTALMPRYELLHSGYHLFALCIGDIIDSILPICMISKWKNEKGIASLAITRFNIAIEKTINAFGQLIHHGVVFWGDRPVRLHDAPPAEMRTRGRAQSPAEPMVCCIYVSIVTLQR